MTTTPRAMKASNLQAGTWHFSTQVSPPANVQVLCTNKAKDTWFDSVVDGQWQNESSTGRFAWQLLALPHSIDWT